MRSAIIVLAASAAAISTAAISTAAFAAKDESRLSAAPPSGARLPSGQCIRSREIRNHTVADARTLLLDVGGKATYRVTMYGACLAGAISSDPIITRNPPGSDIICRPLDMDIGISKGGDFESRCIVESIVKMSAAEVAALPRKLRP